MVNSQHWWNAFGLSFVTWYSALFGFGALPQTITHYLHGRTGQGVAGTIIALIFIPSALWLLGKMVLECREYVIADQPSPRHSVFLFTAGFVGLPGGIILAVLVLHHATVAGSLPPAAILLTAPLLLWTWGSPALFFAGVHAVASNRGSNSYYNTKRAPNQVPSGWTDA